MSKRQVHSNYTIGNLAKELNINLETIRFYHRRGLLKVPTKTRGPYREYSVAEKERIKLIMAAKSFGFKLDEIKSLIDLLDSGNATVPKFIAILEAKIQNLKVRKNEITYSLECLEKGVSVLEKVGTAPQDCEQILQLLVEKPT